PASQVQNQARGRTQVRAEGVVLVFGREGTIPVRAHDVEEGRPRLPFVARYVQRILEVERAQPGLHPYVGCEVQVAVGGTVYPLAGRAGQAFGTHPKRPEAVRAGERVPAVFGEHVKHRAAPFRPRARPWRPGRRAAPRSPNATARSPSPRSPGAPPATAGRGRARRGRASTSSATARHGLAAPPIRAR